ncbi:MAG: hypothetical protein AABX61_02285 [Nanoarchaeota archaeon]
MNLIYDRFYDKRTNTENLLELGIKIRDKSKRHNIIGLNLILNSLDIKNSSFVYDGRRDTIIRIGNSINVSNGLITILSSLDANETGIDELIISLEQKIDELANNIKMNHSINLDSLINEPLYEAGTYFYFREKSYLELGNAIETNVIKENILKEDLIRMNKLDRILKKHYKEEQLAYKQMTSEIDRLKAKMFSKEESIMRRQIVKMLGYEVD